MKLTKIFGIVLSLHVGVILLVMFQPGCQVLKKMRGGGGDDNNTSETKSAETAVDPAFNAGTDLGQKSAETETTATGDGRFPPTRPSGELIIPGAGEVSTETSPSSGVGLSPEGVSVYKIARGDTLWGIARKNNVSLNALLGANPGLNKNTPLNIGQQVLVPDKGAVSAVEVPATPTGSTSYTVKNGDSITRIAAVHGTTISAIVELNGLANANSIRVGQTLAIPAAGAAVLAPSPSPAPPSVAGGSTYVVKKGDNLTRIAVLHGTTVTAIMGLNGMTNANSIKVGQTLVVSTAVAPIPAAPLPAPAAPGSPKPTAPDGRSLKDFFDDESVPVVEAPEEGTPAPPKD